MSEHKIPLDLFDDPTVKAATCKTFIPCRGCNKGVVEYQSKQYFEGGYCSKCVKLIEEKNNWREYLFENREKIKKLLEEI